MGHVAVIRFRVGASTRDRLARLRDERHVNVSSWLRAVVRDALDEEFGPPAAAGRDPGAEDAPAPLPGWRPCRVGDRWGAAYDGDASALPADLVGLRISVRPRSGTPWVAAVTAVIERSASRVVVLDSGRPE